MRACLALAAALFVATPAFAQIVVNVSNDIAVSTTWTANNQYNLTSQIFVLPGATLTIEAGTVIASTPTANGAGSLAVTQGARIFVNGTANAPVIMTSTADVATWTNGDPKTGTWREAANEWGNLTIMGRGYISEDATVGNTPVPSATNTALMEGLTPAFVGDPNVIYGGGDDDDNSGSINYLSIRYGGRVVGLTNELNGLSLGGVGRDTDISHIEIMNNVDDGIEIWGGAVNLKHFAIWNIGDDSLDIDQGWRGRAQFGLIVQGYSDSLASQGSGIGDNAVETDGAENSFWQPVTTTTLYNLTVIGEPNNGDGLTAWRDNARVQYRNSIFMDGGERVVRFDNDDGDGAAGYGANGTLSWPATWTTSYTATSSINAPAQPGLFYRTQFSGNLAEITDSVFFNNTASDAYNEALARGVFAPANNNVISMSSPIRGLTRSTGVGPRNTTRVLTLDPRPANDALNAVSNAPTDGFWDAARYRGAFGPDLMWTGWTAADAFGFLPQSDHQDLGNSLGGALGAPQLSAVGNATGGQIVNVSLKNGSPFSSSFLAFSTEQNSPVLNSVVPDITAPGLAGVLALPLDATGSFALPLAWGFPAGFEIYAQVFVVDFTSPTILSASNALNITAR